MKLLPLLACLLLPASPALADFCSTQTPPPPAWTIAPGSPCNSLPQGEATARYLSFGEGLGVTHAGPPAPKEALAPTRR